MVVVRGIKVSGTGFKGFLLVVAFVVATLIAGSQPASAARGELEISDWGNGLPSGRTCGGIAITFYNASTAPILNARVLYYTEQDFTLETEEPFRSTKAKSWVTFKMYLKPGKSKTFERVLCSTLPPKTGLNPDYGSWQEDRAFIPVEYRWEWA